MKERLDTLVAARGLAPSRSRGAELIRSGKVTVAGKAVTKAAALFPADAEISIEGIAYVSRSGEKLENALRDFGISPEGMTAIDVGSSTGGFTECLLRGGAKKVYAIDVGTDQLAEKLRSDPRVAALEQTDIRTLKTLPEPADLAVIDVSFISLREVLLPGAKLLKSGSPIIALVKPQFETPPEAKSRRGIVKSEIIQNTVLEGIKKWCEENNLRVLKEITASPAGENGNVEFFLLLKAP